MLYEVITNARKRGIVGLRDRSLKELFEERLVLYKKYADFSIRIKGRENVQRIVITSYSIHYTKLYDEESLCKKN